MTTTVANVVVPLKDNETFFLDGQIFEVHDGTPVSPEDELLNCRVVIACVVLPADIMNNL